MKEKEFKLLQKSIENKDPYLLVQFVNNILKSNNKPELIALDINNFNILHDYQKYELPSYRGNSLNISALVETTKLIMDCPHIHINCDDKNVNISVIFNKNNDFQEIFTKTDTLTDLQKESLYDLISTPEYIEHHKKIDYEKNMSFEQLFDYKLRNYLNNHRDVLTAFHDTIISIGEFYPAYIHINHGTITFYRSKKNIINDSIQYYNYELYPIKTIQSPLFLLNKWENVIISCQNSSYEYLIDSNFSICNDLLIHEKTPVLENAIYPTDFEVNDGLTIECSIRFDALEYLLEKSGIQIKDIYDPDNIKIICEYYNPDYYYYFDFSDCEIPPDNYKDYRFSEIQIPLSPVETEIIKKEMDLYLDAINYQYDFVDEVIEND